MMKSFLNAKVRLAFGFAMLTLLLMGSFSYRWMVISDESARWVRHTHEVDREHPGSGPGHGEYRIRSRGFVLTGKESDLEPTGPTYRGQRRIRQPFAP
jgi:CHASE3 domain sensor protein